MASSILGKRSRHCTDFAVVVPPQLNLSTQTNAAPAHRSVRHSVPTRDDDDFEAAVFGLHESGDQEHQTPKRQKRVDRVTLSPTTSDEIANSASVLRKFPVKKLIASVSGLENVPPMPSTPRRRDSGGIVKKSAVTPLTPRHRITLVGKPLTPRSQPGTPSSRHGDGIPSVLGPARSLFARGATPGKIIGREEEKEKLADYLGMRIENGKGGCLYISGPPGTGKSALLSETLSEVGNVDVKKAYVNCMVIKDPKGIYTKLLEEFWTEEMGEVRSKDGMEELEGMFVKQKGDKKRSTGIYVVVLDEIDHLLTKDQEILYSIFEWSLSSQSRLILIGIANALDLTDRFLPRLKARNLKPQLLPFHPYSAPQIASVISTRLKGLLPENAPDNNYVPYIHPAAIQLCARKVAAHTGDLRKAFDMCRRGLELLDSELKEKVRKELAIRQQQEDEAVFSSIGMTPLAGALERMPLGELNNTSVPSIQARRRSQSPPTSTKRPSIPTRKYDILTGPRVTIAHIARISSAAFGGSAGQRVKTLNLQQKAVLCACCVSEQRNCQAPTMRELYTFYTRLCKRDRLLAALTNTEFRDVVGGLESAGVVGLSVVGAVGLGTPSKKGRKSSNGNGSADERKVSCLVGEKELRESVAEVGPILSRIFTDE